MLDNNYCKVEDFLLDDSFVEWVLGNSEEQDSYWENFLSHRPECEENMKQASAIILSFKIKPVADLSTTQVDDLIANVMARFTPKPAAETEVVALPQQKSLFRTILKYAAAATIIIPVCVASYTLYNAKPATAVHVSLPQTNRQVYNASQSPMLIKLPDHSSVVLKPGAQLRYPIAFTGSKREVSLTGEAFFEVAKNPKKPFFVYSNELTVRVVGTSFVVRANKNDSQFKIIVSTGRVEVFTHNTKNSPVANRPAVVLTPNQQAVLYRSEVRLEKAVLKKPLLLSKESTAVHFNFVGTPFSKVISAIEEAYGVTIVYNESVMANCQLTASLIDQPLDERLKLICKAVEADYKIEDGHIVIEGPGCN